MFRFIRKQLSSRTSQTLLGRWAINHSKEKNDWKIDNANRDHCGPCGTYDVTNTKATNVANLSKVTPIEKKKTI
jgi:hypothetical protein